MLPLLGCVYYAFGTTHFKYVAYVLTLIRKLRTKMCVRLRDNIFEVFGFIISLYAAARCRKELPVEF